MIVNDGNVIYIYISKLIKWKFILKFNVLVLIENTCGFLIF